MSSSWITWIVVTALTGNPLIGLAVVVALAWAGEGWFRGRMWTPNRWYQRWERIRRLRTDIAVNPHDATAKGQLGGLLMDRSPAEARTLLEEVHGRYPDMAVVAFHLGAARLNVGDGDGGRSAMEHALSLKKDVGYGEPMIRLGRFEAARGRYAEAITCFERALQVHTSSAEAMYELGMARKGAGDREGALRAWQDTIDLGKGAPDFKARQDRPWRIRAWVRSRLP
ncbi:MAG: tetratricopeptide repeat protein [Myxococcales bacterium]|nr:tetratricopeptide repeat protein [Myxococcales bacterium]